jgi:hypothetical protein
MECDGVLAYSRTIQGSKASAFWNPHHDIVLFRSIAGVERNSTKSLLVIRIVQKAAST